MKLTRSWGPRIAAAALAMSAVGCKPAHGDSPPEGQEAKKEAKKDAFGKLSVDEVEALIPKGTAAIFDNNSRKRWAESHVPTAKWVDYKAIEAKDLPEDKGKQLIFYCSNTF